MILLRDDRTVAVEDPEALEVLSEGKESSSTTYAVWAHTKTGRFFSMGGGYTKEQATKIVLVWTMTKHNLLFTDLQSLLSKEKVLI